MLSFEHRTQKLSSRYTYALLALALLIVLTFAVAARATYQLRQVGQRLQAVEERIERLEVP